MPVSWWHPATMAQKYLCFPSCMTCPCWIPASSTQIWYVMGRSCGYSALLPIAQWSEFFLKCRWIACIAKSLLLYTLPLDISFRLVVLFFPFRIVSQLHIPLQLAWLWYFFQDLGCLFFLFSIAQGQCLKLNCLAMWCKSDKRNQMSPMCSSAESYSAKTRSVSFWS